MVGQGTLAEAQVSQAVLDNGVVEHFEPGEQNQQEY